MGNMQANDAEIFKEEMETEIVMEVEQNRRVSHENELCECRENELLEVFNPFFLLCFCKAPFS